MATTASRRIELYVRSLASRTGRQERVIETLRRLEAAGDIDEFDVHIWGREVRLSTTAVDTACGQDVLDTVAEFREWASETGVSLDCAFENRSSASRITGEEYTSLRLPVAAMAEYEGKEIRSVTPHEHDGTVQTVENRLSELEGDIKQTNNREVVRH